MASGTPPWTPSPEASQLCTQPGHTVPGAPLAAHPGAVGRRQTPACRRAPPTAAFSWGEGERQGQDVSLLNCTLKMVNFVMCFLPQLKSLRRAMCNQQKPLGSPRSFVAFTRSVCDVPGTHPGVQVRSGRRGQILFLVRKHGNLVMFLNLLTRCIRV